MARCNIFFILDLESTFGGQEMSQEEMEKQQQHQQQQRSRRRNHNQQFVSRFQSNRREKVFSLLQL